MARETWVQSQVESYQRLKKWYLPPCLTLSIVRYGSRVKWSNPGKGVAPSPTPWYSKLSKREPSGRPRLWSPTLLLICSNVFWETVAAMKIIRTLVLTTTTLSRHLTIHLNDPSSIALHLKSHSIPKSEFRKNSSKKYRLNCTRN